MSAQLISHDSEVIETAYPLTTFPVIIGRGSQAHIRLNDRWVSRANTEILVMDGSLFVRDLGSSNGTLVNGVHVTQSPLRPGDKLTVGMSTFVVTEDGGALEQTEGSGTFTLRAANRTERSDSDQLTRAKPR